MSVLPHNEFFSLGINNVSTNSSDPTIVISGEDIVDCGHIAIVSIIVGNKTGETRQLTLTVEKAEQALISSPFSSVSIPSDTPFDLMRDGSKIFLNKDDVVRAWTDQENSLDLLVSYAMYTPSNLV